jgi:hypothetical protein
MWENTKREKSFLVETSTHLMNWLMHVHVVMRSHGLKVQMLLISLRLRACDPAKLKGGGVPEWNDCLSYD